MAPETKSTVGELGEFALIERIDRLLREAGRKTGSKPICVGIGDDAAIVRPERGRDLVLTCDTQIAGRHFLPNWMTADQIGHRAMTVNLSDLAAMGASPRWALVSLGLHRDLRVDSVLELYRGFLRAFGEIDAEIIGGNISSVEQDWFCDITLVGSIKEGRCLARSGARPGDAILVTGTPGASAAGLELLQQLVDDGPPETESRTAGRSADRGGSTRGSTGLPAHLQPELLCDKLSTFLNEEPWAEQPIRAYLEPVARLAEGQELLREGLASALIDISDGLTGDLMHLCQASGVRARLEIDRLPELTEAGRRLRHEPWHWALRPSDDYELLFTTPMSLADAAAEAIRDRTGVEVTQIGDLVDDAPGIDIPGLPESAQRPAGWNHFRAG